MPRYRVALALLAVFGGFACSGGDKKSAADSSSAAPTQNWATIMAQEFTFDAPDTLPAGFTRMNLMNHGTEPHHMVVVRLDSGHVVGELLQAVSAEKVPNWVTLLGGPNATMPGATTETVIELTPGNYAILCVISSTDGTPHVAKGMVRQLTVKDAATATVPLTADIELTLSDYAFKTSTPITPGPHVIRVVNIAEQPHEVTLVKLEPGKTMQDFLKWAAKPQGPAPGAWFGGTTPQSKGITSYIVTDFTPGEYGFICYVPDAKDRKSHHLHGMVDQFKVG
jgi:uncharacterized cupredoxin-like copper-binding protein